MILKSFAKSILFILGAKIIQRGKFPKKNFLFVSNHLSYLDIQVYYAITPCCFLSKSEVASWPFLGILVSLYGTLYIDRKRKRHLLEIIPKMAQRIKDGDTFCFFPEGTSTDGKALKPFYSSFFTAAIKAKCPVIVSTIAYYAEFNKKDMSVHDSVCWGNNGMNFAEHAYRLAQISKFTAYVHIDSQPNYHENSKILSKMCRERTLKIFHPSKDLPNLAAMNAKIKEEIKNDKNKK